MADREPLGRLHLYCSNRTERLFDALASILKDPLADPMATERLVINSDGMARWLTLQMANEFGVACNISWDFPGRLVDRLCASVPISSRNTPVDWSPSTLQWVVLKALREFDEDPRFLSLHTYIQKDESQSVGRRQFQLAQQIAEVFHRYMIYRPVQMAQWAALSDVDSESNWQAVLWHRVVVHQGTVDPSTEILEVMEILERGDFLPSALPERICLFAPHTLPPVYLQLIVAFSSFIPIHLFLLTPSKEHWQHIQSKRAIARALAKSADTGLDIADLGLEEGHPLLASLGKLGRDFQWMLLDLPDEHTPIEPLPSLFEDPGRGNLLQSLQADLLNMEMPGSSAIVGSEAEDDSIRLCRCVGEIRQVEALRDTLLHLFDRNEDLHPDDVLVLCPDLPRFAPLIDAVFSGGGFPHGQSGLDPPRIPVGMPRHALRTHNSAAGFLLKVFSLCGSRLTASDVLGILELAGVKAQFGIQDAQFERIQQWVESAGIRWGRDGQHCGEFGCPERHQNTWGFGFDRLFLGYASRDTGGDLFHSILPIDDVEGDDGPLLGEFMEFWSALQTGLGRCAGTYTLEDWAEVCFSLLDTLWHGEEAGVEEVIYIRQALLSCGRFGTQSLEAEFTLDGYRSVLNTIFASARSGTGSLFSGGVTVCTPMAIRGVPYSIICMLGFDEGTFPRAHSPISYDLTHRKPALGDRTARDDEKYLFLEAILSSREHFVCTFGVEASADNTQQTGAVPIEELVDVLVNMGDGAEGGESSGPSTTTRREEYIANIPLQSFSPDNFIDRGTPSFIPSFDQRFLAGAKALIGPSSVPTPFISTSLPMVEEQKTSVRLEDLSQFLASPAKHLMQKRLGIYYPRIAEHRVDREPTDLDSLDRYHLGQHCMEGIKAGWDHQKLYERTLASGLLPSGVAGELAFQELYQTAKNILGSVGMVSGSTLEPISDSLQIGPGELVGHVIDHCEFGLCAYRFGRIRPEDIIGLWVSHLFAQLACSSFSGKSMFIGKGSDAIVQGCVFEEVTEPDRVLRELLDLYDHGQNGVLPFYQKASYAYAELISKGKNEEQALSKAKGEWTSSFGSASSGDSGDPHLFRLLTSLDPFHDRFVTTANSDQKTWLFSDLAMTVWEPILGASRMGNIDELL